MAAPRFDGAVVWATLTPEQQAEIGAAALEYASGDYAANVHCSGEGLLCPRGRAAQEAWGQAADALLAVVVDVVPRNVFLDAENKVLIPSSLGPYCRACGCSENDPCLEGCGWAEEDLCTACAGKAL